MMLFIETFILDGHKPRSIHSNFSIEMAKLGRNFITKAKKLLTSQFDWNIKKVDIVFWVLSRWHHVGSKN